MAPSRGSYSSPLPFPFPRLLVSTSKTASLRSARLAGVAPMSPAIPCTCGSATSAGVTPLDAAIPGVAYVVVSFTLYCVAARPAGVVGTAPTPAGVTPHGVMGAEAPPAGITPLGTGATLAAIPSTLKPAAIRRCDAFCEPAMAI